MRRCRRACVHHDINRRSPWWHLRVRARQTRLIRSLGDPEVANGCAVDVTTGNLAVANRKDSVAIYVRAKGKPKMYYNSKLGFAFCGSTIKEIYTFRPRTHSIRISSD